MAESGIQILVSNTGGASPSGESANKIRDNLQKAFSQSPVNVKIQASTASVRSIRDSIIAGLKDIKIDVAANIRYSDGGSGGSGGSGGRAAGRRSALGVGIDYSAADAAKSEAEKLSAIKTAHEEWSKKIIATVGRTNTKLKAEAERIPDAVIREDAIREINERTNSVVGIVQRLAKSTDKLVPDDLGPLDEAVNYLGRATSEANALYNAVEKLNNKLFANTPTGGVNDDWLSSAARQLAQARATQLDKATRVDDRGLMYGSMAAIEDYSIEAEQFLAKIASQSGAITSEQEGYWKNIINLIRGATDEYIKGEKQKQAELANTAKVQEESVGQNSTSAKLRRAAQERMYKNIDMAVYGDKDSKAKLAAMRKYYKAQEEAAAKAAKKTEDAVDRTKKALDREADAAEKAADRERKAAEAVEKARKKRIDSNKVSNQDYVRSIRMDTDRYADFYHGKTDAAEYKRVQELLGQIDGLLKQCEADSNKWTGSQKKEIRVMLDELGRLQTATEKTRKGMTVTAESQAQANLGLAKFEQYLATLKPKALTEMAGQIQKIRDLFRQETPAAIKEAQAALKQFQSDMKTMGYEGGNILTYIGEKIKTFSTYLVSSTLTMGVMNAAHQVLENVKAMDDALTDLRIVTGDTKEETKELLKTYNDMAQQLGTTTASVSAGATDWLRQGYDTAQSAELLKQSMTLSIVGAMESAEATDALTAAMKGYQLSVEDASSVVDKFFKVDMAAATSSSDMALALAKTAANAKLAGLSLDDVIAQLAVVNETMKESGEETGSFYNTMLSRMGALKGGRLADPESGEDLSNVETTLRGMDIALRDSSGQFRNFGEVLDEVGGKWDSFSNVQQRAIATAFAGTRQQTRFLSLMAGWEKAGEYAESAANSTGIAAQKLITYQESIEAKAQKMAAAFENMSMSWLSDDLVGGFYDMAAGAFNLAASLHPIVKDGMAITAVMTTVFGLVKAFKATNFGKSILNLPQTLGWPAMTGDIVPIYSKEAA